MATTPMPNPQDSAPSQGGAAPASQPANQLQTILGRLAQAVTVIGQQNTVIQPEMQQARSAIISALQKSSQAAPGPPSPLQVPSQQ